MKRQALLRSAAIVIGAASSSLLALLASPLPGMAFTLTSDSKGNPSIKGSWIGSMTHDGGGTNVVDITLTAPAQTFAGSTGALATLIDGLGHGTTTTFKINYSVKPTSADEYIYIPAKPNGKWYDWIITGEPTMAPDCANNDPDCGNVSSLMSVIFSGWVAPPLPQPPTPIKPCHDNFIGVCGYLRVKLRLM